MHIVETDAFPRQTFEMPQPLLQRQHLYPSSKSKPTLTLPAQPQPKTVVLKAPQRSVMVALSGSIPRASINSSPNKCVRRRSSRRSSNALPRARVKLDLIQSSRLWRRISRCVFTQLFISSPTMAPSVNLPPQWNGGTQRYCPTKPTMTFPSDFLTSISELRIRQSRCMSSTLFPSQLQWKNTKSA